MKYVDVWSGRDTTGQGKTTLLKESQGIQQLCHLSADGKHEYGDGIMRQGIRLSTENISFLVHHQVIVRIIWVI